MDILSYLLGKNAGGAKGLKVEVVETLPQTGESNVLYLVPKQTAETSNVFDEYLYINNAWEKIGTTDIDLSGYVTDEELLQALATKQNTMQYSTMPTASADNLGKIVQYTGTTDSTYTNGHFYIVVSDGETEPTYSWEEISFGGGSGSEDSSSIVLSAKSGDTISNSTEDRQHQILLNVVNTYLKTNKILNCLTNGTERNGGRLANVSVKSTTSSYAWLTLWFNLDGTSTFNGSYWRSQSYGVYYISTQSYLDIYIPIEEYNNAEVTHIYSRNNLSATNFVLNTYGNGKLLDNNSELIGRSNTTAWTPSSNYNPATKLSSETVPLTLSGLSAYDSNTTYQVGDYVYRSATDLTIYKCNTADTTGTWDSTLWDSKTYMEYMNDTLVGSALGGSY